MAFVGTLVVVFLVFPTTVETLSRGKSLGKWAFGLRTVRDDAGPISFQHAFVRALVGFVEIYATGGGPAFFCAMLSPRGKRLGDYAAGTYVVRERIRLRLAPPPSMPLELAAWARAADVASLPTGLALAVRQFLMRSPGLDPGSRVSVGSTLAQQVSLVRRPAAAAEHPTRGVPRGRHRHPPRARPGPARPGAGVPRAAHCPKAVKASSAQLASRHPAAGSRRTR